MSAKLEAQCAMFLRSKKENKKDEKRKGEIVLRLKNFIICKRFYFPTYFTDATEVCVLFIDEFFQKANQLCPSVAPANSVALFFPDFKNQFMFIVEKNIPPGFIF